MFNYRTSQDSDTKKRLYVEVRFAKHSTTSLPRSSEIFRLKRVHKELSVEEYAENLTIYLGKVENKRAEKTTK